MSYSKIKSDLLAHPRTWLVTGVAGFIGSNLLETLLKLNQKVVGLDNFITGHQANLDDVHSLVDKEQWSRFNFIEGDICDLDSCAKACEGVDYVLHQAALGSVPRSIENPIVTNKINIDGFLNILVSARDAGVKRIVYAASSSTYGDHQDLPKVEDTIGRPLSPYAVTKYVNELYADVFANTYNLELIGLRYFNIFGKRQDPNGGYAAVIPKWIAGILIGKEIEIYGDGQTSRDFCYIDNAVQANLLAAVIPGEEAVNQVYNIAVGERTSLDQLYELLTDEVKQYSAINIPSPIYGDFRTGDVRHSLANVDKARSLLGYEPSHTIKDGIKASMPWYLNHIQNKHS